MNKRDVLKAIIAVLQGEHHQAEQVLETTHQTINNAPDPTQSHSDTTRFQATEVVREMTKAFDMRTGAVSDLLFFLGTSDHAPSNSAVLGSIVKIDSGDSQDYYILLPTAGGTEVEIEGEIITVISADSPLAKAIRGQKAGFRFELRKGLPLCLEQVL